MTGTPNRDSEGELFLDEKIIDRVLAWEASTAELAAYDAWKHVNPIVARHLEVMHDVWDRDAISMPAYSTSHVDAFVERALSDLPVKERGRSVPLGIQTLRASHLPGPWAIMRRNPLRQVGLALGIVLCGVIAWRALPFGKGHDAVRPQFPRVYRTASGQVMTLTLFDGSHVTLAPNSVLRASVATQDGARTIMLSGAAYFNVIEAAPTPFVVRTDRGSDVRVLGTSFTVTQYPHDVSARVAVTSGRVVVTPSHGQPVTVSAGMVAQLDDSSAHVAAADVSAEASWRFGTLVFDETPIPKVLATLSRWYGVQFRLGDSALVQEKLSARFDARSSTNGMAILTTMLDVTLSVARSGDTTVVTLHSQPRRTRTKKVDAPQFERTTMTIPREVGR
jgi:ferric-dicitrate binding protein FerR (iron transport regulator)